MAAYRKRPVVIEAFKLGTDEMPEWFTNGKGVDWYINDGFIFILTLEGVMTARPGDYIIRGIKGEIYPCKPDIFDGTYEEVIS